MFVQWNRTLAIGVPKVDNEHKHLVDVLNAFYRAFQAGVAREKVFAVLNMLLRYAEIHFRNEEALMEAANYPELQEHRKEHERLIEEVFDLNARCEVGKTEITFETMEFLKHWLLDHILAEDKKLRDYFEQRGIPPGWES